MKSTDPLKCAIAGFLCISKIFFFQALSDSRFQVVAKERPDLEKLKKDLTRQQNEFKITLKSLEVMQTTTTTTRKATSRRGLVVARCVWAGRSRVRGRVIA